MRLNKSLVTACTISVLTVLTGCANTPKQEQVRPDYLLGKDQANNLNGIAILVNGYRTPEAKAAQAKAQKEKPLFKFYSEEERNLPEEVDASLASILRMDGSANESYRLTLDRHGRTWPYQIVKPGTYQLIVHCSYGQFYADIPTVVVAQKGKTNFFKCTVRNAAINAQFNVSVSEAQDTDKNTLSMPIFFH